MSTFTIVIMIICMTVYTIFGVWQISQFKKRSNGIVGTTAIIAGSIGVYAISPVIAALVLWLLKAVCIIVGIIILLYLLGS